MMRLHYFDIGGRAYPIRCALQMAKVEYENVIIDGSQLRRFPMKSVPVLEAEGRTICQTAAIMEYLGPATGLVPTDNMMHAKHTEMLGCLEDVYPRLSPSVFEQDPEKKARLRKAFSDFLTERWLPCMDALIAKNGSKRGFSVCDSVTFADIWLTNMVDLFSSGRFEGLSRDCCKRFRHVMQVHHSVEAIPEKKKYDASVKPEWR
eukprot:Polyplicarium_translucidae@DN2720_c0_g1_i5.p2